MKYNNTLRDYHSSSWNITEHTQFLPKTEKLLSANQNRAPKTLNSSANQKQALRHRNLYENTQHGLKTVLGSRLYSARYSLP